MIQRSLSYFLFILTLACSKPVILMGGQSNMQGIGCDHEHIPQYLLKEFPEIQMYVRGSDTYGPSVLKHNWKGQCIGPELSYGYNALQKLSEFDIIKIAWGGTNMIHQWRPPSAGPDQPDSGVLYREFVKHTREALELLGAREDKIKMMLWLQGESDSGSKQDANKYEELLSYFIHDLRKEFNNDFKFVIALISKSEIWTFHNIIRQAQINVALKVPNCDFIDTQDLILNPDKAHYNAMGEVEIGKRFADKI